MVRLATVDDATSLAVLCNQVQEVHVAGRPDVFSPSSSETLVDWFRARLAEPANRAWLADVAGEAVGYAFVTVHERAATPFTPPMRWLEIVQFGVSPAHQRRGLARAIFAAVIDEARREGIHDIRLKTWAFNAVAQAAFRGLGFRPRSMELELRC